jgi:hypothetical protein
MLSAEQVGNILGHSRHTILRMGREGQFPFTLDQAGHNKFDGRDIFDFILKTYRAPVDDKWGAWFSGLVDGEGHFGIQCINKRTNYQPVFQISLRVEEEPIIREIHQKIGCGVVYISPKSYTNQFGQKCSRVASFHISSTPGALRIIDILDAYPLRTNKKEDYAIWHEFIDLKHVANRWNRTEEHFDKFEELFVKIKQVRRDRKIP